MNERLEVPELDAEQVAAWLAAHPRFFVGRDELLEQLLIPHEAGHAVSLVERQLRLLRERNHELRTRLTQLMDIARDNDRLFERTRRLIVALLDAESLEELVAAVEDGLRHDFQVPCVSLLLFSDNPPAVGRWVGQGEAQQRIGALLGGNRTVCGVLRAEELAFLFPAENLASIGSAAVAVLDHQGLHGVLALGSPDPQHYKSSLGTVFLAHVAEIVARLLPRLVPPLRAVR
ncbi:DUF484 family protein [Pseudomonas stutzeri]|nr:DUF484 family protein [Stutzerimonas stutzeri]